MFSFSTWEVPWTFISKCFFSTIWMYLLCFSPPPGKNHGNVFLCCFAPAAAGKYIPFIFWHLCSGKANRVGLNRTSLLVSKKHKLRNVVKLVETSAKKQNTPQKNSTLWNVERVVWEGDRVLFESRNAIWGKTPQTSEFWLLNVHCSECGVTKGQNSCYFRTEMLLCSYWRLIWVKEGFQGDVEQLTPKP